MVSAESLVFMSNVARTIREQIRKMVHPKTVHLVESFYADTVEVIGELREAMCRLLPLTTLRMDDVKASMLQVSTCDDRVGVSR